MTEEPAVNFRNVTFHYFESPNGVEDVTLLLQPGNRVLVLGENGASKSTIFELICGKRRAQEGVARVLGSDAFDDTSLNRRVTLIGPPWPPEAYFANTVDSVASPAPLPARKAAIAEALHLRLTRPIDKMSAGEKRRVQVLHGMLHESDIYCFDEVGINLDVAERLRVLQLVRDECEQRGACCLYATHILDDVRDWATHVVLVKRGRIVSARAASDVLAEGVSIEEYAHRFMAHGPPPSFVDTPIAAPAESGGDLSIAASPAPPAMEVLNLTYKDIFHNLSFSIRRGARALLVANNGCGKTMLLSLAGGQLVFPNRGPQLRVLGKACYDDMTLNGRVAFCGNWWPKPPGGQVFVREMVGGEAVFAANARAERLRSLLAVNLEWDVRHISSGEQKRVQLLLHLLAEKELILVDEGTSDLDVSQRYGLLQFLFEESVQRGVTVVYATHIFQGLSGWPTECVVLDRTTKGLHAVLPTPVDLATVTQTLIELKAKETF